jgi:methionyl-tRNA formyltransferase
MKVVLVTHDSVFGRYVAATLAAAGVVDRIIVETARATASFYWRKLRRVGPVNFAFQFALNRWFVRHGARVLPSLPLPAHERVASVNTVTFANDELVMGFGTSYISAATLAAAPNGILNLHTGVLPQYRGVKSEFWAIANRDHAHIGWTVHYMTPRLDAGDIVLSGTIPWDGQNPAVVRTQLLTDAMPAIAALLGEIRRGGDPLSRRTAQDEQTARYYTTPTWREWRSARAAWRNH